MNTGTFVFMIATYWVGGSGSMEGGKFLANGQVYRNNEFVAAHRTLPLGTILHVCLRRHCISVVVKDRGPFLPKMDIERRIDLSYGAAKALDMLHDGRQRVRVSVPMPKPRPEIESKWQEASSPRSQWLGGIQFDFAGLQTEQANLSVGQNSFEPDRFICEGAMVEHLKPCLLVGVGNSRVQWPVTVAGRLNGNQPAHWAHTVLLAFSKRRRPQS